jgi:hypothetical protein
MLEVAQFSNLRKRTSRFGLCPILPCNFAQKKASIRVGDVIQVIACGHSISSVCPDDKMHQDGRIQIAVGASHRI